MFKTHQAHCTHCRATRHFRKRSINHLAHLSATVCTFGLWSLGWLAKTIQHARKPWRCTHCGSRLQPVPPPVPTPSPPAPPRPSPPAPPRAQRPAGLVASDG